MIDLQLSNALHVLKTEGIIAYPTEAVFGLGCDPDSDAAIEKILTLKDRPAHKGLILIAANIDQLTKYADFSALNEQQLQQIKASWPGPVTWVVPAQKSLSKLITGDFDSVAVRVSAHPVVQDLCLQFSKPIISTSANLSGCEPCIDSEQVKLMFSNAPLLSAVIDAPVSGLSSPSKIFDALTGKQFR
ncbi:Sua5/YciO/YrdC/YwlC family protein [Psychromonas sp. MME2]|uniref:Sua5/YciO/YrdC/YwlC family protein n=1 Tax=unclassified Psychromonas TaxID=2614957 RepID=UPI00339BF8C2